MFSNIAWNKLLVLFLIYTLISAIIAFFYYKNKLSVSNKIFNEYFFSSLVALLLLPVFLTSLGNKILEKYFGSTFNSVDFAQLLSYVVIVSLAGRKIIDSVLVSLNLDFLKDEIRKLGAKDKDFNLKLNKVTESTSEILERQVVDDIENIDIKKDEINEYIELLSFLNSSKTDKVKIDNAKYKKNTLISLSKKMYIKYYEGMTDSDQASCKITSLGIEFLDKIKAGIKNSSSPSPKLD